MYHVVLVQLAINLRGLERRWQIHHLSQVGRRIRLVSLPASRLRPRGAAGLQDEMSRL